MNMGLGPMYVVLTGVCVLWCVVVQVFQLAASLDVKVDNCALGQGAWAEPSIQKPLCSSDIHVYGLTQEDA